MKWMRFLLWCFEWKHLAVLNEAVFRSMFVDKRKTLNVRVHPCARLGGPIRNSSKARRPLLVSELWSDSSTAWALAIWQICERHPSAYAKNLCIILDLSLRKESHVRNWDRWDRIKIKMFDRHTYRTEDAHVKGVRSSKILRSNRSSWMPFLVCKLFRLTPRWFSEKILCENMWNIVTWRNQFCLSGWEYNCKSRLADRHFVALCMHTAYIYTYTYTCIQTALHALFQQVRTAVDYLSWVVSDWDRSSFHHLAVAAQRLLTLQYFCWICWRKMNEHYSVNFCCSHDLFCSACFFPPYSDKIIWPISILVPTYFASSLPLVSFHSCTVFPKPLKAGGNLSQLSPSWNMLCALCISWRPVSICLHLPLVS